MTASAYVKPLLVLLSPLWTFCLPSVSYSDSVYMVCVTSFTTTRVLGMTFYNKKVNYEEEEEEEKEN